MNSVKTGKARNKQASKQAKVEMTNRCFDLLMVVRETCSMNGRWHVTTHLTLIPQESVNAKQSIRTFVLRRWKQALEINWVFLVDHEARRVGRRAKCLSESKHKEPYKGLVMAL